MASPSAAPGAPPPGALYPYSYSEFSPDVFRNPSAHYRGAPLWSWNCKLDVAQLEEQIGHLSEMGMGGAHIHSRTGLEDEYLGPTFFEAVKASIKVAKEKGMLTWLYDEDRWPSGSCGGQVTKAHPEYAATQLLFTTVPYGVLKELPKSFNPWRPVRTEDGQLLAKYAVKLSEDGSMANYKLLAPDEEAEAGSRVWYAYVERVAPNEWYNYERYVDTMNPAAVKEFIATTHGKYYKEVGEDFGSHILGIFTDEPQFAAHKASLDHPFQVRELFMPWTPDLPDTFSAAYGYRIADKLPELFWQLAGDAPSLARYHYHDHVSERFTRAFADTIGQWCRDHHISLTGHMMHEDTLQSQTEALGEAMRSYRAFALPGIDMLFDSMELNTAKQAQSASHQFGREGVMSEIYGVTNWDFSFVGHKAAGDWQAALGVTFRVPHLTWVSMRGEAKRDFPASIGYQSPWYREYKLVEDYFSRVNVAMTRGRAIVRIGVIHPVESFWLAYGPLSQTSAEREERQESFASLTTTLLYDQLDFDFISESLFPSLTPDDEISVPLKVGHSDYHVILVPNMRTIRKTTLDRLERFHAAGGRVIFIGDVPPLVDASPSPAAARLASEASAIPMRRRDILSALRTFREVEIELQPGKSFLSDLVPPKRTLLHQIRQDGESRWVFICNTDRKSPHDNAVVRLKGEWDVTQYDAMDGTARLLETTCSRGWTALPWNFPAHGSLLLRAEPRRGSDGSGGQTFSERNPKWRECGYVSAPTSFELSEPNVLLLDIAEFRIAESHDQDTPWEPVEELLRLDDRLRERYGFQVKGGASGCGSSAQPWATRAQANPTTYPLQLRFTFTSSVQIDDAQLAIEDPELHRIVLDGVEVPSDGNPAGYFVDRHIPTLNLPPIAPGTHTLHLSRRFGSDSNLEWLYLLGSFGVTVAGRFASVGPLPDTIQFGDWTTQGFPFYAGNLTYSCDFTVPATADAVQLALQIDRFAAPLLRVQLDDDPAGGRPLAFAPFVLPLGTTSTGSNKDAGGAAAAVVTTLAPGSTHRLRITAYGSRVNAFGALHNAKEDEFWFGPDAWRTTGANWCYEYMTRRAGVLLTPKLLVADVS